MKADDRVRDAFGRWDRDAPRLSRGASLCMIVSVSRYLHVLLPGLPLQLPEQHWELYQLGEELTDLEDTFRLWRFRHVTTVERIIGFKRGTGGTSGVGYLRKMLDVVLFPEIWKLRTDL